MSNLIRVNGQEEELAAGTVVELLRAKGIDPTARFLAVAVNGIVRPRRDWPTIRIGVGDHVEIVRPMSGG